MSDKVLVTGGAGFIGSNVVRALEREGHSVVVCDRLRSEEKWKNLARSVVSEIVEPDLLGDFLARDGKRLSGIIHLGAVSAPSERDADLVVRTNLTLSQDLWRYAEARGLPFIYASSAGTYGDGAEGFSDDAENLNRLRPLTPYAWAKHLFDLWATRQQAWSRGGQGVPPSWAGLKFFNVYGQNEWHKPDPSPLVVWAARRRITLFEPSDTEREMARDFVAVEDVVKVILWAFQEPGLGRILNVGTGTAVTWEDLARRFYEAYSTFFDGAEIEIKREPMPEAMEARYQWVTKADLTNLHAAGYKESFTGIEVGVLNFVTHVARKEFYR